MNDPAPRAGLVLHHGQVLAGVEPAAAVRGGSPAADRPAPGPGAPGDPVAALGGAADEEGAESPLAALTPAGVASLMTVVSDPFQAVLTEAGEAALAWLLEECVPALADPRADRVDLSLQWGEWLDAIGAGRLSAAAEHGWSPQWLALVVRAGMDAGEALRAEPDPFSRAQVAALAALRGPIAVDGP